MAVRRYVMALTVVMVMVAVSQGRVTGKKADGQQGDQRTNAKFHDNAPGCVLNRFSAKRGFQTRDHNNTLAGRHFVTLYLKCKRL